MLAKRITVLSCAFVFVAVSNAFAQQCQPGYFSGDGNEPCNACSPGSYSDAAGSVACNHCQPGYFAPVPGSTQCEPCPANTYTPGVASASCLPCPQGETSPPGSASCSPAAVPTVSEWGLAILALTGLIAGTMLFDARRQRATAPVSTRRR